MQDLPGTSDAAIALGDPVSRRVETKREWRDLIAVGVIAILAIILSGASVPFSIPFGLLAVIFAPGYALAAATLPADDEIDWISRLGIALGMSFAVIAVITPIIDRLPGGMSLSNIRAATTVTTLGLLVLAGVRRGLTTRPELIFTASAPSVARVPRAVRFTQAIVVVNLAIAGIAYSTTIFFQPSPPTAFYILGSAGQIADYPREAVSGQSVEVQIGIEQTATGAGNYRIVVNQGEVEVTSLDDIAIANGGIWSQPLRIPAITVGEDQEFKIVLMRTNEDRAYRTLRFWMTVLPPGAIPGGPVAPPSARP